MVITKLDIFNNGAIVSTFVTGYIPAVLDFYRLGFEFVQGTYKDSRGCLRRCSLRTILKSGYVATRYKELEW